MKVPIRPAHAVALGLATWVAGVRASVDIVAEVPNSIFQGRPFVATLVLSSDRPGFIGSYAAELTWPADRCEFLNWTPGSGTTALSSPNVNDVDAVTGLLRLSAADPFGDTGRIELFNVTLAPIAGVGSLCEVVPWVLSLHEAGSFDDLSGDTRAIVGIAQIRDPRDSLVGMQTEAGTTWNWVDFGGVSTYDVIRGDLSAVTEEGLGSVVCVEDDSSDTTTAGGHEVPAVPPPGAAWFFLLRGSGEGYGTGSGGVPRSAGPGDCSQSREGR